MWEKNDFEKKITEILNKIFCLIEINIKEHDRISEPFILTKKNEFNKNNCDKFDKNSYLINKNKNEKILIQNSINSVCIYIQFLITDNLELQIIRKIKNYINNNKCEMYNWKFIFKEQDDNSYNFGYLITNNTLEIYKKEELIHWICNSINWIYNLFNYCKINLTENIKNIVESIK